MVARVQRVNVGGPGEGASGKEAERGFWSSQNAFSGLHHLTLIQFCASGMWLLAQILGCLGPDSGSTTP